MDNINQARKNRIRKLERLRGKKAQTHSGSASDFIFYIYIY